LWTETAWLSIGLDIRFGNTLEGSRQSDESSLASLIIVYGSDPKPTTAFAFVILHDFEPKWPLQAVPRVPNVLVEHVAERIPHSGSGPVESLAECGDSNPRIIEPAHMLVVEEHGEQHRVWIGGQIFLNQYPRNWCPRVLVKINQGRCIATARVLHPSLSGRKPLKRVSEACRKHRRADSRTFSTCRYPRILHFGAIAECSL
jgi:hypothetical protein